MTRLVSWLFFLLSMTITVAAIGLMLANRSTPDLPDPFGYREIEPLLAIAFSSCGLLLTLRVPGNRVGWLLCAVGLMSASASFLQACTLYGRLTNPGSLPAPDAFAWLYEWSWVPQVGLVAVLLPLLFPNGRIEPSQRRVAWLGGAAVITAALGVAFSPGQLEEFDTLPNPYGAPGLLGVMAEAASFIGIAGIVVAALLGASAQVQRYRRADGDERHQIKWFAAAITLVAITFASQILVFALTGTVYAEAIAKFTETGLILSISLVPLAVGIAVLRYHLYDIDVLINRTLVYVPLTAILGGLYVALVGLMRAIFTDLTGTGSDAAIALSTLLVASLLTPAKNQLQVLVDRRFRQAPDPTRELLDMTEHARSVLQVVEAERYIEAFVSKAKQALDAAYIAVDVKLAGSLERRFEAGNAETPPVLTLPLDGDGNLGQLLLGPRAGNRPYSVAEIDALTQASAVIGEVIGHRARSAEERVRL